MDLYTIKSTLNKFHISAWVYDNVKMTWWIVDGETSKAFFNLHESNMIMAYLYHYWYPDDGINFHSCTKVDQSEKVVLIPNSELDIGERLASWYPLYDESSYTLPIMVEGFFDVDNLEPDNNSFSFATQYLTKAYNKINQYPGVEKIIEIATELCNEGFEVRDISDSLIKR